mmetsp:Transcript_11407/g.23200  ORF Transcript_11407/g.23200 Transcript_11407/m.23200 type:complete len:223 (+) Transcript_11407:49-717(+)|eukprot:CAMPEP_0119071820 /NCGR_PEP_ID=MMETSP1178-20130426/54521_1 /TAXON_ID=33656 /ORGANISM="unid sp, Strain CCMP2000" /LENGTH=222 /DNA_ID=CAMNT_0007053779 /DNA_START=53 /DNA_END=721 /DNA_ORIENTATION=-
MCFFCPDTPPEKATRKGPGGDAQKAMLDKQNNPHVFAIGLAQAPCKEPLCCCASSLGTPCGITACWARKAVLEKYANGMDDYVCCQGYVGKCCCIEPATTCKGSPAGLCLEGCCCPMVSLSIARLHLMDAKQVRPDPCDYKIICCSNTLQLISCVLDIIAIFVEQARDLAELIGCLADLFTCSVGGCMGAQVHHEIKLDADGVKHHTAEMAQGAPESQEMKR